MFDFMGTENTLKVIRIRLLIVFKMPKGSEHLGQLQIRCKILAFNKCAKEIGINDA